MKLLAAKVAENHKAGALQLKVHLLQLFMITPINFNRNLFTRCRTPVGQMIIFGQDPARGNKLVS
jgi:hypothetical protein